LTGRRQLVTVNGTKSELHITGGVPTGSILGYYGAVIGIYQEVAVGSNTERHVVDVIQEKQRT
jgi:hypothetical protein